MTTIYGNARFLNGLRHLTEKAEKVHKTFENFPSVSGVWQRTTMALKKNPAWQVALDGENNNKNNICHLKSLPHLLSMV